MALIPQVKCSKCDRKYSGLRTRCPFCGASRYNKGSRSAVNDNSMWKLIVGIILLVVLVAAVVVLIVTSVSDKDETENQGDEQQNIDGALTQNEGVNITENDPNAEPENGEGEGEGEGEEGENNGENGEGEGENEGEGEVTPVVQSVTITYGGSPLPNYNSAISMYEFTMNVGESLTFGAKVVPDDTGLDPVWSSDDESVLIVLATGEVTGIKSGTAHLSVTVGDVTTTCLARVK